MYRDYTRELDKVPVTKCFSYIHLANGPAILNLVYPKEHVYYMLLIYSIILLFWNLLYSSVICDYNSLWQFVIVMYDIILNSNPKSNK